MNFSILSIGTELTTGQIINKNSSWIASQLKNVGIETNLHLAVPDEKKLILDSLDFCASQSEVLFVTGGLGPTTDDFTRDMIAEWFNLPLKFDEESWIHIENILNKRQVSVKAIQKQQCYFPEGSRILKNSKGTANGFMLIQKKNNKELTVFVLPGPPPEIEAIWNDHIQTWIDSVSYHLDKTITHSWDTLGYPESDIAQITEEALKDLKPDFPLTKGYRAHLPYIEVKLSYPKSVEFTAMAYIQKVEKALAPMTVLRNFEKAAELWTNIIQKTDFAFYDFATQGALHQSLAENLKKQSNWMWKQSPITMESDFFTDEENFMALINADQKNVHLMADLNGKKMLKNISVPERLLTVPGRRNQYVAEMSLIELVANYRG